MHLSRWALSLCVVATITYAIAKLATSGFPARDEKRIAHAMEDRSDLHSSHERRSMRLSATAAVARMPHIVRCPPAQELKAMVSVGAAEYSTFFLTSQGVLYSMGGGNALGELGLGGNVGAAFVPKVMPFPSGTRITQVVGGLHQSIALDAGGNVWTWGAFLVSGNLPGGGSPDRALPHRIVRDNLGNPFTGVASVYAGRTINAAIKTDGTLWVWGDTAGGYQGDGSAGGWTEYPTQVTLPSSAGVKQFSQGAVANALMNDGSVYSWGGFGGYQSRRDMGLPYQISDTVDYTRPQKVAFDVSAGTMVAMAVSGSAARIFLNDRGEVYGFGYHGELLGQGTGAANVVVSQATPKRIDVDLGLPRRVKKIFASNSAFFAILDDDTLWGWGDAAQGEVGNGQSIDWAKPYGCERLGTCGVSNPGGGGGPYKWDWSVGELIVLRATRLLPEVPRVLEVYGGNAAAFYVYAIDSNQRLYSWGRNKTGTLGNGVYPATGSQSSILPNSWDVPLATPVDPLNMRTYRCVVSPFCKVYPADAACVVSSGGNCPTPPTAFAWQRGAALLR